MNLIQKFKNWYNTPNRSPITLRNIYKVIQSWYRRNNYDTPLHIIQQQDYRFNYLADPICKKTDLCPCGCSCLELSWANDQCPNKCWGVMMTDMEWRVYKRDKKISIYEDIQ